MFKNPSGPMWVAHLKPSAAAPATSMKKESPHIKVFMEKVQSLLSFAALHETSTGRKWKKESILCMT